MQAPENQPENETPTTTKTKKPKWLKALEKQSWQAELLISGILIVNLFGLPDQVIEYFASYIIQSSPEGFLFYDLIILYLLFVVYLVIAIFMFHFGLRILWIALLGLNSVFPKGIKRVEYGTFSISMVDRVIKEFPDLSAYNKDLDRQASLMFSIAAMITMIFLSITFIIFICFLVFLGVSKIFPAVKEYFYIVVIIATILLMLPATILAIMKKMPSSNREKSEHLQYTFSKYFSKTLLTIFYTPASYISNILISNGKQKHAFARAFIGSFLLGMFMSAFISSHQKSTNILKQFAPEKYMTFNNQPNIYISDNYETTLTDNLPIYTPIIPSDMIIGTQLKLFIPTIEREIEDFKEISGDTFWKRLTKQSKITKEERRAIKVQQHKNLNQIYVNDRLYSDLPIRLYTHPHDFEKGILTYIPTENFKVGENILEIRKDYYYQDTLQKIVRIPFFYEGAYQ